MLLQNLRLLNRHVVLAKALRALKMLGRTFMVSRLVERQREIIVRLGGLGIGRGAL